MTDYKESPVSGLMLHDRPSILFLSVAALTTALLMYIAFAIYIGVQVRPTMHTEFEEGGVITALSSVMLGWTSGLAFACFILSPRWTLRTGGFWLLLAAGLAALSIDEIAQIHERLGSIFSSQIGQQEKSKLMNDLVVAGYGVVAAIGFFVFYREISSYRRFLVLVVCGFLFYVFHTVIDTVIVVKTSWHIIMEESAKLFAVAFFSLGVLYAFLDKASAHR